jgi:hypothetical protein
LGGEKVSHDDEVPAEVLESPAERSARLQMRANIDMSRTVAPCSRARQMMRT